MLRVAWVLIGVGAACASGGSSPTHRGPEDHSDTAEILCEGLRSHVAELYRLAADAEEVPSNLRTEFVESTVHMTLRDCRSAYRTVAQCLEEATSVTEIETRCLLPLDDAGLVEGARFMKVSATLLSPDARQ